jgi:hypothetical protein
MAAHLFTDVDNAMMSASNEIRPGALRPRVVSWRAGLEAYLELKAIQREE